MPLLAVLSTEDARLDLHKLSWGRMMCDNFHPQSNLDEILGAMDVFPRECTSNCDFACLWQVMINPEHGGLLKLEAHKHILGRREGMQLLI